MVRRVKGPLEKDYFNKQCLVLVHWEQNSGKSTWWRFLCPPALSRYFAEDMTTDKDARIQLTRNFIINLDELFVLAKKEMNALKAYFSKTMINERLPYGYELLNSQRTNFRDFRNVLSKDWDSHNSKIQLNMDGPSSREFYEHLSKAFPGNTMTMKDFFIRSKLILRSDGKKYNYNTIKSAPVRTPVSKYSEILVSIFRKLK